jgi:glycosyltransferase involved in cell wall biosynthesis
MLIYIRLDNYRIVGIAYKKITKGRLPVINYQVVWKGPVLQSTGIGTASREYVLALHRQGIDLKAATSRNWLARSSSKPRVLIYHGLPHRLDFNKARKHFKYIMLNTVWETTKIPTNWFPHINRYDAVCVPSVQNKTALRNSGVKVPVFIVPHGVHTQKYSPLNKKLSLPVPKNSFVFVSVFTFQHRKNPEVLLRAYWEEFSSKDRVALVIKTNGFNSLENSQWIRNRIYAYKKRRGVRSNTAPIQLITNRTSSEKLKGLYTAANAFVLPTRGEGVGLPFLEALASGIPVIATRWGGHMDFLTDRNSFLINYQLKPTTSSMKHAISRSFSSLFAQKGQRWAEPVIGHLRKQMRFAYEHPALCRKKGMQGRRDMHKHSWNRAGLAMKRAVEQVIRSKRRR